MQIFNVRIQGISPYSQSRVYEVEREQGEGYDDYSRRTWRNYMHVDRNGDVFIPPNAFKNCLGDAAKYMNIRVPGKDRSTYTKHFDAGVQVAKPIVIGVKASDVTCERLFLPADGRRGSGKRIWKYYPRIETWSGVVELIVLDETVLHTSVSTGRTVLEDVLVGAGQFIGLGRFRPRNAGFYGRFDVTDFCEARLQKAA